MNWRADAEKNGAVAYDDTSEKGEAKIKEYKDDSRTRGNFCTPVSASDLSLYFEYANL